MEKYAASTCTYEEFNECINYFDQASGNEIIQDWLQEEWMLTTSRAGEPSTWEHLYPLQNAGKVVRFNNWMKLAAAAVIVLGLSMAVYYFIIQSGKTSEQPVVTAQFKNEIPAPTGAHTILKLANGSEIILDSVQNGKLAEQGNAHISKTAGDEVIYSSSKKSSTEVLYNTLATSNGGNRSILLDDGTRVWLNALSTLKYPVVFTGNERVVELTGEAYFEVAPGRLRSGQKRPFNVKIANGSQVEVLGTHFNIMAYGNETEVKTTLLEGKVKVTAGSGTQVLAPGQQAIVNEKEAVSVINANTEEAIAWKNNLFWFENTDMQTVMRQISRWYDVDFVFVDKVDKHITGTLPKNVGISTLLKVMEESGGIHFTINGKNISVSK